MAAAPAESSGSHGKGLGLSRSDSSPALDYSGDTFESFSEEQESETPGSWCSTEDLEGAAASEALESSSSLAGQSPAEEEFEAVDPAAMERAAIGKWIDAMGKRIDLKNKDTGISCQARHCSWHQRFLLQVTEAEIHETSTCPDCLQKEAELAKVAFLRRKKTLLEGALIQEKLEEKFYSRDMLTLLGEALRNFPKPSEDPRDLWQRLKGQEWKD
ncbi:Uncharacterized protein C8orf48 [Lonchura striata]|uniref:Uncharacterized protein C8orf48 n=1 Tax=Lonchura striata TaxID=40157 RepID=A0A218UTR9_9PASE|nr:Uncharacterized protein C8orf48 [Lonchura striata domestica]